MAHVSDSFDGWREKGRDDGLLFEVNVRDWTRSESAANKTTHVSEPYEVACFSRLADRSIAYGSRQQLKRFKEPPLNVSLAAGFSKYIPKRQSAEGNGDGVEPVVEMLIRSGFDIDVQADIVSYRNNLNKIANSPYNYRDPWEFDAVQVGRCVFLDIRALPEPPTNNRLELLQYQGYKFEALCTEGNSEEGAVDSNPEWCVAMRIRIGNVRIVVSAEIDAEMPSTGSSNPNKNSFVELKTTRITTTSREYANLYSKYQRWWVQSWLAGVRTIFVGVRDDNGNLVDVQHLATRSLPRSAREGLRQIAGPGRRPAEAFEPMYCVNFIEYMCEHLRRCCGLRPGETVRFAFNPSTGVLSGRLLSGSMSSVCRDTLGSRVGRVLGVVPSQSE
jgi:RAT1-interacting protein